MGCIICIPTKGSVRTDVVEGERWISRLLEVTSPLGSALIGHVDLGDDRGLEMSWRNEGPLLG